MLKKIASKNAFRAAAKILSADLAFLQNMYQTINSMDDLMETCVCPACGEKYKKPINFTRAE